MCGPCAEAARRRAALEQQNNGVIDTSGRYNLTPQKTPERSAPANQGPHQGAVTPVTKPAVTTPYTVQDLKTVSDNKANELKPKAS